MPCVWCPLFLRQRPIVQQGCPQTYYVAVDDLELLILLLPPSTDCLKVHVTMPAKKLAWVLFLFCFFFFLLGGGVHCSVHVEVEG